jgi:hypothetical protein
LVGGALTTTQTCVNKLRVRAVRTIAIAVVTLPGLPGGLTWQVATVIDELPANREDIRQRVRDVQLDGWMRPTQVVLAFSSLSSSSTNLVLETLLSAGPRPNPRLA